MLYSLALIIELSKLFHVSTDYLLGVESDRTINAEGLSEAEVAAVVNIVHCLQARTD